MLKNLYNKPEISEQEIFGKLMEYRELLAPYVGDAFMFIHNALKEGKNILLEGQLGSLKDTDFGIYPMVTSSNTIAGYGAVGAGIPPYEIKEIITVVKAYSSAVGAGEFVSEILEMKQMSFADAAATAVNLVQLPEDLAVWVGLTLLQHATVVWFRVQLRLHLQCLMYLDTLMKFLFA